jgi:hypothetical protein
MCIFCQRKYSENFFQKECRGRIEIQCPNILDILVPEYVHILLISYAPKLRKVTGIKNLKHLMIHDSDTLSYLKIDEDSSLESLDIARVPKLKSITGLPYSMTKIFCYDCPQLEILQGCRSVNDIRLVQISIKELSLDYANKVIVSKCPRLQKIEIRNKGLSNLNCSECAILTELKLFEDVLPMIFQCKDSPWLNYNGKYKDSLKKLIILQKFCRKNMKYFIFRNWIKSEKFAKWFYHPENYGGKIHKMKMTKFLEDVF